MSSEHNPISEEKKSDGNEVSIRVEGLCKCYHIYDKPHDRLLQMLMGAKCKRYREFWALRDVSFEINRGDIVGIVGRNGSGKSTLLQILCGTLSPTAGSINVYGRVAALLELGTGFNPEFSGRENVFLSAALYGLTQKEIEQRFDRIAAFADIGEFIERPIKTYSSGMFVRLAFAVIAHVDADILVIDEALAVGDAYFVQKCMRFLREFAQKGTLLFVSHDTSAVVGLCNKAIFLDSGEVKLVGTPKDVVNYYLALWHSASSEPEALTHDETAATDPLDSAPPLKQPIGLVEKKRRVKIDANLTTFGTGAAQIVSVALEDASGNSVHTIHGGEAVTLEVVCQATTLVTQPIVGFVVKDRIGQAIFGGNTYLTYPLDTANEFDAQDELVVEFEFVMPILQSGEYVVDIAIASGTQLEHIQHHWIYSAATFRAVPTSLCFGLITIPMQKVLMNKRVLNGM